MDTQHGQQNDAQLTTDTIAAIGRRGVMKVAAGALATAMILPPGLASAQSRSAGGEEAWTIESVPYLLGRTVIVTGGNGVPRDGRSGLGFHQAHALARAGADVVIASRNVERGGQAVAEISQAAPGAKIRFEVLDLADLASIKAFAARFLDGGSKLDILINNAGVMGRKNRETSVDGFERVLATNTIGHFALTAHLMPALKSAASARVVWVSSLRTADHLPLDDLQLERRYDYAAAYDNSKLANLMLAFEMHRRSVEGEWGVSSLAAHPGVCRTNLIPDGPGLQSREGWRLRMLPFLFQPPERGAHSILYAAVSANAAPGGFFGPTGMGGLRGTPGVGEIPAASQDADVAASLWNTLKELAGVSFT
jgi:NAD(P)-dependent dehydrogenase (short-subunit alcohol dehydrogenase family)